MPNFASRSRAHGLGPGLGAEAAVAQRELAQIDAHAGRDLGDVERVGRRRAEDARAEILHQRHLPLGGAARDRNGGEAEPLGAVVEAEPAGEQPVAIGIVEDVAGPGAHAGERARHQVRPEIEIGLGVADHGRLAGRARGGMQPQQVLARHGEQAERISVAQVGLDRERQARDVGERLDLLGLHAGGIEFRAGHAAPWHRRARPSVAGAQAAGGQARRAAWSRPRDRT